jgi:hypothetical protein
MEVTIRKAKSEESRILTDISFASKRFWKYPEAYFDIWKKELTITEAYVQKNIVNVEINFGGKMMILHTMKKK